MVRSRVALGAAVLALVAAIPLATFGSPPTPIHPGTWTARNDWGSAAVHLALLRGDMSAHRDGKPHSEVFYFTFGEESPGDTMHGGLYAWSPKSVTSAGNLDTNFTALTVSAPPRNIFCSGHAHLPNGSLLFVGGHEGNQIGLQRSTIFDRSTNTWADSATATYRRWYGTGTALPDGRILASSGDQYSQIVLFGGRRNAGASVRDTVDRMQATLAGGWDASFKPSPAPGTPTTPDAREQASLVSVDLDADAGPKYLFGGHASSTYYNDAWILQRYDTDQDQTYQWTKITPSGTTAPTPRALHAAAAPYDTLMYVCGGIQGSTVFPELWLLQKTSLGWQWFNRSTAYGQGPPALYGHTAVYIPPDSAIVFFGGKRSDGALQDSVYVLSIRGTTPHWIRPVVLGTSRPAARYLHSMASDPEPFTMPFEPVEGGRAFMFGGQRADGLSNELWRLSVTPGADTVQWDPDTTGNTPPPRSQATLVFHGDAFRLVMFGGDSLGTCDTRPWSIRLDVPSPQWQAMADVGLGVTGQVGFLESKELIAPKPELYDPSTNSWSVVDAPKLLELYPHMFVDSTGTIFEAGPTNRDYQTWRLDLSTSAWTQVPPTAGDLDGSSSVMYRPGYVMKCGTRFAYAGHEPVGTTEIIQPDQGASATWDTTANDMLPRALCNLTLMPTGEVFVNGGYSALSETTGVYQPEIWDPDYVDPSSGRHGWWYGRPGLGSVSLATDPIVRCNHSSSLLLPDARILTAGGDDVQPAGHEEDLNLADVYSPPYLYNADGSLAIRPRITGVQESISYNSIFDVSSPDSVAAAVLMRAGATTHEFNQDQRWVRLARVGGTTPCIQFRAPANSNLAPPGDYMLFLLSPNGVPSVAEWVRLGSTLSTYAPCDTDPPATITSLTAITVEGTDASLQWQAPVQNRSTNDGGAATTYEMRIRAGADMTTLDDFLSHGTLVTGWSGPSTPGVMDTVTIRGLSVTTTYYVRVISRDNAGSYRNWSDSSNSFSFTTTDGTTGGGDNGCHRSCDGSRLRQGGGAASLMPGGSGTGAALASGENTILSSTPIDVKGLDLLPIDAAPSATGLYLAHVREPKGQGMLVDAIKLLLVDHPAGTEAFVRGGSPLVGARSQTTRAIANTGADVTSLVNGSGAMFSADSGATITVTTPLDSLRTPLVVECASWVRGSRIMVEAYIGATWQTVGSIAPRGLPSAVVIDSVPAGQVRLRFTGYAQVSSVARLAEQSSNVTSSWGGLQAAASASGGDVRVAVGAEDSLATALVGPDTLWVDFSGPVLGEGLVRSTFLATIATPVSRSVASTYAMSRQEQALPVRFALRQNAPNPFHSVTTIRFDLPAGQVVRLEIYDLSGRRVRTLLNRFVPAGYQSVEWDHRDQAGASVAAGVYFYRLQTDVFRDRKKMTLTP